MRKLASLLALVLSFGLAHADGLNNPPVFGTAATQPSTAFLNTANNLSDVPVPATGRASLGLTTAATTNIGTSGATIPLLSTANTWAASQTFSGALTYGGVTLANSVTGTGSMVLSGNPTLTGTILLNGNVVTGGSTINLPFSARMTAGTNLIMFANAYAGANGLILGAVNDANAANVPMGFNATAFKFNAPTTIDSTLTLNGVLTATNPANQINWNSNTWEGLYITNASATANAGIQLGTNGSNVQIYNQASGGFLFRVANTVVGTWTSTALTAAAQVTAANFANSAQVALGIFSAAYDSNANRGLVLNDTAANGSSHQFVQFAANGTAIGSITNAAGTGVAYNTTSDMRLKTDPRDVLNARDVVMGLKVRDFKWKSSGERSIGVYAQEAYEVFSQAVAKPKNPDDNWQVDYSKFVPELIAHNQAMQREIDQLKRRKRKLN